MSSQMNVVITETLDAKPAKWLGEQVNVTWCSHEKIDELNQLLATTDGLIVRTYTIVNDAFLDRAPKLKVVGRAGVGLDNIDLVACKKRNIPVVFTPDANTQAVVEYVFGLMLDMYRPRKPMPGPVTAAEFHQFRKVQVGLQLDELTLGILGFGRIGKRLGKVAHALGMKLLVNDILPEKELRAAVDFPFDFVDKKTLYANSDILTIHVDGRPENHQIVGADALSHLKKSCLLVNAARGMLVDHAALGQWAKLAAPTGGRVILDVHDPEPPPPQNTPDYPLYGLPNVYLLPHLASRTDRALENMSWVVRDVVAVLNGQKPQFPAW